MQSEQNRGAFLDLPLEMSDPSTSRYAVLPIPYEHTVTYKPGTSRGPAAIIDASAQVEWFDEELKGEFVSTGITTRPEIPSADDPWEQLKRIREAGESLMREDKFLLSLGGEHSVTVPLVQVAAEVYGEIGVLQIDAHADLRNKYDGTNLSHACVMRRVLETTPHIRQVGIRSYSLEEFEQCPQQAAEFITPKLIYKQPDWVDKAIEPLPQKVYVTIDADGLDPSIAPGVGTPEPGGLTWRQITSLLRTLCEQKQVVAADIVEVRPIPPNHITEYTAARLAYKLITYTQTRGGRK